MDTKVKGCPLTGLKDPCLIEICRWADGDTCAIVRIADELERMRKK